MEFGIFVAFIIFAISFVNAFYGRNENDPENRFLYFFTAYMISFIGMLVSLNYIIDVGTAAVFTMGLNASVLVYTALEIYYFNEFDYFSTYDREEIGQESNL